MGYDMMLNEDTGKACWTALVSLLALATGLSQYFGAGEGAMCIVL